MKSKFVFWLEAAADKMFSEKAQAVGLMATFGTLGVAALIGAFWNPWQLFIAECAQLCFYVVYLNITN